jgi:hypothetical protein
VPAYYIALLLHSNSPQYNIKSICSWQLGISTVKFTRNQRHNALHDCICQKSTTNSRKAISGFSFNKVSVDQINTACGIYNVEAISRTIIQYYGSFGL